MAKTSTTTIFLCSQCGNDFLRWHGKCPACGEWGSLKEFSAPKKKRRDSVPYRKSTPLSEILFKKDSKQFHSNIREVDRTLGGGILSGSVILLGGSPGIGKSTLALQIASGINSTVLYVSAEENEEQISLRVKRIGTDSDKLVLTNENRLGGIAEQVGLVKPEFIIIDSIQTIYEESLDSPPGSVGQIRECGQQILELCKTRNISSLLIGHVTKEGVIAGPKMLEHIVDTVMYLEGETNYDYRILRVVKNRFGPTHEVGIFEMTSTGLSEVENPSAMFLEDDYSRVSGSTIVPVVEGSRPIFVEVQSLVTNANYGSPQRNVTGFDSRRLNMLLAVLEKRMGFPMGTRDVFINTVGGVRIIEPAADLAVITSIASSYKDIPVQRGTILLGEVGLGGEIRKIPHLEKRLTESTQLGFLEAVVPEASKSSLKKVKGMKISGAASVKDVFEMIF